jgi:hypothetical protein
MWEKGCEGVRHPSAQFLPGERRESRKQRRNKMTIRIRTHEFVRNGKLMYRVVGIKGVLPKERLDSDYTSEMPSFWLTKSRRTLKLCDGTTLSVNGEYKKSVFTRILREINKAGDRLHAMNREKHITAIKPAENITPVVKSRTFKI